ncbi:uncharacterized protein ISCGN_009167 [Ixodes scapularis]
MERDSPKPKRQKVDHHDQVPLHILLEYMFDGPHVYRDSMDELVEKVTQDLPLSMSNHWISLRTLLERWTKYQETIYPNQEQHEREWMKITNPLRFQPDGQRSYDGFRRDEELCTMLFPLEVLEKLRACIKRSREALRTPGQDSHSQPSLFTSTDAENPTCTWSTTAHGQTDRADALPSMGSTVDQIALRFGLVMPPGGTTGVSSCILLQTPVGSSTLRWQEPIGANTLELRLWNTEDILDVEAHEQWKHYLEHFRVQVPVKTAPEVQEAIKTLCRYAQERVLQVKPEDVKTHIQKNRCTESSSKIRFRR